MSPMSSRAVFMISRLHTGLIWRLSIDLRRFNK